jgi:hypothetical protein
MGMCMRSSPLRKPNLTEPNLSQPNISQSYQTAPLQKLHFDAQYATAQT